MFPSSAGNDVTNSMDILKRMTEQAGTAPLDLSSGQAAINVSIFAGFYIAGVYVRIFNLRNLNV